MNFTSNARWNILLPNIDIRDRKVKKYENIKFLTNIKTVSRKRENHASYTLLALNTAVSFRLFDKIFLNGHWLNTSECWAAVSEICILICDWPQLTTDKWRESKQSPSWKYCLHKSFYTVANLARGHIILLQEKHYIIQGLYYIITVATLYYTGVSGLCLPQTS